MSEYRFAMIGTLLDRITQQWVKTTGRRAGSEIWLAGPVGLGYIGDQWLTHYLTVTGGRTEDIEDPGLISDMSLLDGGGFSARMLHPAVVDFYEHTSLWRLELWSQWSPWFRPLGGLLAALFSRRLQQLNLPLDPLDVSKGMTSDVTPVMGLDGSHLGTAWQRTLRSNGNEVFGGFYGVADLPKEPGPAVRVVFPLPNGSITVFLRPENAPGGGLRLVSNGREWGEVGVYLVVEHADGRWARRVPLPERFEVYVDDEGVLRADHGLDLWRWPVLRMHYRMERLEGLSLP